MNKIILFVCCSILFFSCNKNEKKTEGNGLQISGDTLQVSPESNILSKIKLLTVQSQSHSAEFDATGTVKAITGSLVEIAPPFEGRVSKSFVRLGQRVSAGTPVFELNSSEFYEVSKNYFQMLQNKKMADANLKRQKDLVQHGVGVVKDMEEAETNAELVQKEYETAIAGLKMLNINPNELAMGQALKVISPITGDVVANNIVLGQFVKNDAGPLIIVADLSKVWIVAQVKEKYISGICTDDQVFISTDADSGREIKGRVFHISELLNEETRSIQVLVECDNKERKLKPGMFAAVHFISTPQKAILIPSSAILQTESGSYVFVKGGDNKYFKRTVQVISSGKKDVVVTDGLKEGEEIVSEGGIYLMGI